MFSSYSDTLFFLEKIILPLSENCFSIVGFCSINNNRFKAQHKGGVCNIGLWNYSRHPNYFFDWLTWLGFTLFGIQSNNGYLGLVSLLLLYLIFTRITGPLTERGSVQSRGQKYIDYQNQTSVFFPWFKTKIDSE
jgi:steroid 5-alpha reductase family enzyme